MKAFTFLMLSFRLIITVVNSTDLKVVDGECVYSKIDQITSAKINQTTQICCRRSGVHARYQEEMEIDCCGEGIYKPQIELCCNQQVYVKDLQINCDCKCGKSTFEKDENRIKSGAAKGYSPLTHQNRWKELNSLEKRCRKKYPRNSKILFCIWKLRTTKSKNNKHILISILSGSSFFIRV
ncbi:uncharacterized protein LOC128186346 [Crassostrea angulata]|uniref:uncharacterized protein LOC128186346 n=1 Tax=Magallana angulata TaxID=2784310 RepID=UPI0022B09EE6|nr:uncharacterized protein LOC128186346 [Crassostrea angulata]